MAPPTPTFHLSNLESQINVLPSGKPRNPPINLEKDCVLKEMVQYKCNLEDKDKKGGPDIVCQPVVRLLRRCAGGLTVETTAWEGWKAKREGAKVEG